MRGQRVRHERIPALFARVDRGGVHSPARRARAESEYGTDVDLPGVAHSSAGRRVGCRAVSGVIAMSAFVVAAVAGTALGYYMASHQHLSIHPETGQLESCTSTIGYLCFPGARALRDPLRCETGLSRSGQSRPSPRRPDDGGDERSSRLHGCGSGHPVGRDWRRTRPLVAGHAARKAIGTAAGQGGDPQAVTGKNRPRPPPTLVNEWLALGPRIIYGPAPLGSAFPF